MGLRLTCAVTLSNLSRIAWRKPVFIESAMTSVVTPAATPTTASSVTIRSTAGRFGERRYRNATSHSNVILLHRSFHPAALQPRRLPCATEEKEPLRGSRANQSAASRDDRCRRPLPQSEVIHAKEPGCNRYPLLSAILHRLFQLVRENAAPDQKGHSAPKSRSQSPSRRRRARIARSAKDHPAFASKAAKYRSENHR